MPTLKCSVEIDAPAREVWRVLTTPALVREWAAAYLGDSSNRTPWKEGDAVTWKARDGAINACGMIATVQPEKLLKFDYAADLLAERRSFSETFRIEEVDDKTLLLLTTGPLDKAAFDAMKDQAEQAIEEIKSLAEESAQIHGLR